MAIGSPTSLGTGSSSGAGHAQLTFTTSAAIAVGDLALIAFANDDGSTSAVISSCSIGANSFSKADNVNNGSTDGAELWYCANCSAELSGATVTINHTTSGGAGSKRLATAATVTGVKPTTPLDKHATQSATTAAPTVASGTLSQLRELVIGVAVQGATNAYTQASGFSALNSLVSSISIDVAYQIVAATTTVTFAPTWGGSAIAGTIIATFKGISDFPMTATVGTYSVAGVSTTLKRGLHLIPSTATYAAAGISTLLTKGRHLIPSAASYAVTGIVTSLVRIVSPASKTALRRVRYVLQKLRIVAPTLDE